MTSFHHVPVLKDEVVAGIGPVEDAWIVDGTVGGGGHAEALLDATNGRLLGIDRDPAALAAAGERTARFGDRVRLVQGSFGDLPALASELDGPIVGVLADLGVSSHQLDTPKRGFSFRSEGPLDMRMDPHGITKAGYYVNEAPEDELRTIIATLGEERRARAVARAIVQARPLTTTTALADVVAAVVGRGKGRIHPATRTFQAIRIATNDELGQLERLLAAALNAVAVGGRIAIITFHSLEDRIVKQFFAHHAGKGRPRDPFGNPVGSVRLAVERNDVPAADDPNPRARSARLRTARRLA
ncbi:MAG: 16S rRNA (cytosine(1402)-N(4))-methyltransferase RsmH [Myxococcota bacterium]